ncbi:DsbA family protein [Desertivirga brevis]|uniref:DsbA family protein n=1 Tax=Desertivirga brevis TaxID=2810310 RepID=UPI001A966476|nr:DsbA family protein [Pedobacter sp. SYSU D00873]
MHTVNLICNHKSCSEDNTNSRTDRTSPYIEIIYGYDPLCGWCFGFSSHLERIRKEFGREITFSLINGGIFSGQRKVPMRSISEHIQRNMPNVTSLTGAEFGNDFLNLLQKGDYSYDSEKSSVALTVFRELLPEHVFSFAASIQNAFFRQGKDLNDDYTFVELISPYQIEKEIYLQKLNSLEYKAKTLKEFSKAARYNLSYPSLLMQHPDGEEFLSAGFEPADIIIKRIKRKLEEINYLSTHESTY